jgi:hypothetical protein
VVTFFAMLAPRQSSACDGPAEEKIVMATGSSRWSFSRRKDLAFWGAVVLTSVLFGCGKISISRENRPCAPDGSCIPGYVCDSLTRLCVVANATLESILVTPGNASIAVDTQQQFTATGLYSNNTTQDLTTQVIWTSSDVTHVAISNSAEIGRAHV